MGVHRRVAETLSRGSEPHLLLAERQYREFGIGQRPDMPNACL